MRSTMLGHLLWRNKPNRTMNGWWTKNLSRDIVRPPWKHRSPWSFSTWPKTNLTICGTPLGKQRLSNTKRHISAFIINKQCCCLYRLLIQHFCVYSFKIEDDDLPIRHDIRPVLQISNLGHVMHAFVNGQYIGNKTLII